MQQKNKVIRAFKGKVSRIQQDENKYLIRLTRNNGNLLKNYLFCSNSDWTSYKRKGIKKGKLVGNDCKLIACEDDTPRDGFENAVCDRRPKILDSLTITGFTRGSSFDLEGMNRFDQKKFDAL